MKQMWVVLCIVLLVPSLAVAGPVKTYQVTGPVLEVSDSAIVVQKGKEKWEIARDKDTTLAGDPKVGDKVTIYYRMTATKVEVKESKKPAAPKAR